MRILIDVDVLPCPRGVSSSTVGRSVGRSVVVPSRRQSKLRPPVATNFVQHKFLPLLERKQKNATIEKGFPGSNGWIRSQNPGFLNLYIYRFSDTISCRLCPTYQVCYCHVFSDMRFFVEFSAFRIGHFESFRLGTHQRRMGEDP